MAFLDSQFSLRERFQRSTRIDSETKDELDGFILHETGKQIIHQFLGEVATGDQRAFTWTGPYGSGKSTLALYLSRLLAGNDAQLVDNKKLSKVKIRHYRDAEGGSHRKWLIIRVTAQKESLIETIYRSSKSAIEVFFPQDQRQEVLDKFQIPGSEAELIQQLMSLSDDVSSASGGGLLLIIDEMGKAVEYAAQGDRDLHFFQELAEQFSRAQSRCAVLGILHQSFEEYANRSDLAQRKEWSKVQGRFEDVPFSVNIEESLELIGKAIKGRAPKDNGEREKQIMEMLGYINNPRLSNKKAMGRSIANCFPISPLAALLLPAISRQKFGQNERSVFSFLFSGEVGGFRDYLMTTPKAETITMYSPDRLWDYLELNLQQVILASSIGHRWSEASDAVLRTEERGAESHLKVIKIIALLDLFGRPFSMVATEPLLKQVINCDDAKFKQLLADLKGWSVIAYRQHLGAWVITAGSDVDVEGEVGKALSQMGHDIETILPLIPNLRPVIAKRHYFETGTLRRYPVKFIAYDDLLANDFSELLEAADGIFLLLLSFGEQNPERIKEISKKISRQYPRPVILGESEEIGRVINLCFEFAALRRVEDRVGEIQTDRVARREIHARIGMIAQELSIAIKHIINNAEWYLDGIGLSNSGVDSLSKLASIISDRIYPDAPTLKNELINRRVPSGASNAARRKLMYGMVNNPEQKNLGIEKYPPEKGLYLSILRETKLHTSDKGGSSWQFSGETLEDVPKEFRPLWEATNDRLQDSVGAGSPVALTDIYKLWSLPPFGLKSGVLPILALSYVLARKSELAVYVDGLFEHQFDDLLADHILLEPSKFRLKLVEGKGVRKETLNALVRFTSDLLDNRRGETALAAAQSLAEFAHKLHPWVKRTKNLSVETTKIRDVLLRANDPEKLLFVDLPAACGLKTDELEDNSKEFIEKLEQAHGILHTQYDALLSDMREMLFEAFGLSPEADLGLAMLAERAKKLSKKSGDFKLDLVVGRLQGDMTDDDIFERLVSLISGKSLKDWNDNDILRTKLEIQEVALKFEAVERLLSISENLGGENHTKTFSIFVNGSDALKQYHKALPLNIEEEKRVKDGLKVLEDAISGLNLGSTGTAALLLEALEYRLKETNMVEEDLHG